MELLTIGNKNVPENTKVIGNTQEASGEIGYTYYWKDGRLFYVGDWVNDKPVDITEDCVMLNKLLGWVMESILKERRQK